MGVLNPKPLRELRGRQQEEALNCTRRGLEGTTVESEVRRRIQKQAMGNPFMNWKALTPAAAASREVLDIFRLEHTGLPMTPVHTLGSRKGLGAKSKRQVRVKVSMGRV